jgi:fatty acid desaturase
MGGVSFFSWQEKHNQHHQFCNDEERDPDVNALFIKFYADDPLSRPAWIRWIVRHQAFLIWFLALLHNYDFQRLSWLYVLKHPQKCRAEMVLIPLHFVVYLLVPTMVLGLPTALINYVFIASLTGLILAQVFAINHIGMPTVPGNHSLSFLEQQVETSRNVRVPWFLDEYFGGLNYQIEHHLFPWVPISRYRKGSPIVKAFCDRHQIKYVEEDFWTAMGGVERHLARMGATEARSRPINSRDPLS